MQLFPNKCSYGSKVTTEGKLTIWNPLETRHQVYISKVDDDSSPHRCRENEVPEVKIDVKDEGYLSCEFCNHGNLIAVADQCGYAYVYEVCMPLPKLSQICRNVIRRNIIMRERNHHATKGDPVNELSCIPNRVKSFLSYDT